MLSWGRKGVVKLGSVGKNGSAVSQKNAEQLELDGKIKGD